MPKSERKTSNSSGERERATAIIWCISRRKFKARAFICFIDWRAEQQRQRRIVNRLMIVQHFNAHTARFGGFCTIFFSLFFFPDNSFGDFVMIQLFALRSALLVDLFRFQVGKLITFEVCFVHNFLVNCFKTIFHTSPLAASLPRRCCLAALAQVESLAQK